MRPIKKWFWLDGELCCKKRGFEKLIPQNARLEGGIFETMRLENGRVCFFKEHLARLESSARLLALDAPSCGELRRAIGRVVVANRMKAANIRLNLFRCGEKTQMLLFARDLRQPGRFFYRSGLDVLCVRGVFIPKTARQGIKTMDRIFYDELTRRAQEEGCQEVIFFNRRGILIEGARSNVFFVKKGRVMTPDLSSGCLAGVTRALVLKILRTKRIPFTQRALRMRDLEDLDEGFLTNAIAGIIPIAKLQGVKGCVFSGRGPLTEKVMAAYASLVVK